MWIIYALSASAIWGLTYVLGEQIYKKISVITSLSFATFVSGFIMLLISYFAGYLQKDFAVLSTDKRILGLSVAETICLMTAELLIGFSIASKNATLSGLIEISYPIFIAIFAFFIFKENQINLATIMGGVLIFMGIFVIYSFNH